MNKLIFVSGWGTESSVWDSVACEFGESVSFIPWWECLSDGPHNNSLLKILADSDDSVILVGWSLGGMIALSATINCPERVSGLVLISSSARMVRDKGYSGINPRILKAMKFRLKSDKQQLLTDFANMGTSPATNDSIKIDFVNNALNINGDKLSSGLSFLQNYDLRSELESVSVPVNIIHGKHDQIMNPANADYLAEYLSNAKLDIVAYGGHFLIQEHPKLIIESIIDLMIKV